jgi:hypothetical protein
MAARGCRRRAVPARAAALGRDHGVPARRRRRWRRLVLSRAHRRLAEDERPGQNRLRALWTAFEVLGRGRDLALARRLASTCLPKLVFDGLVALFILLVVRNIYAASSGPQPPRL